MATALTLKQYLTRIGVEYDVIRHPPTTTSLWTAEESHVSAERLAKAVVLKDGDDYLLAVLPASHHLEIRELESYLNRHVELASEAETEEIFTDCALGAIPPMGEAYGLETLIDDQIAGQPDIYFEAGDHETLVHVPRQTFERLTKGAFHGRFSVHN